MATRSERFAHFADALLQTLLAVALVAQTAPPVHQRDHVDFVSAGNLGGIEFQPDPRERRRRGDRNRPHRVPTSSPLQISRKTSPPASRSASEPSPSTTPARSPPRSSETIARPPASPPPLRTSAPSARLAVSPSPAPPFLQPPIHSPSPSTTAEIPATIPRHSPPRQYPLRVSLTFPPPLRAFFGGWGG
jgi:hypothetical protein